MLAERRFGFACNLATMSGHLALHGANREDVAVELLHDKGQVGDEAALTQRAILHMMKRNVVLLFPSHILCILVLLWRCSLAELSDGDPNRLRWRELGVAESSADRGQICAG